MSTRGSALARVRAAAPWIVADMDRTLVRKVPGTFPDFNASPVKEPLLRWLGLGGRLFIVTSDDGRRPFHSMWSQIPPELRANGRVLLSTGGGATIFRGDASGDVVEVREFWDEARSGLASPGRATSLACDMMRYTLGAALRARLAEVAPTSVEPIDALHSEVIDRFLEEGEVRTPGWAQRPPSELVDELLASLSDEALLARGGVVPEKALVWRNQPGPPSSWRANWGGNGSFATRVTNVFLMGTPPARAAPTLEAYRARIFAMGVAASSAPSTICLRSRMIDKSVPVAWLDRRCRLGDTKPRFNSSSGFGFATDDAVAIGDNPLGNDAPLATFGRHLRRVGDGALDQSGNAALTRGDWGDDSDDTMVVDQRCGRGEQRQRVVVGTRRRRKCRGAGACGAVHWACHQRRRAVARRWRSLQQDLRLLARRAPAALHPPSLRDAAHRIRLQHPRHVDVHARCCVRQQRFLCVRSMSFLP